MKGGIKASIRILFGLLGISAVVTEMVVLMRWNEFEPTNFFSFFTILSNIFAAVILLVAAYYGLQKKQPVWLNWYRGAATFYMLVTGIVFAVLLSGLEGVRLTAVPWDNIVLHYLIPAYMAIDWLWDRPKPAIPFKRAVWWIAFPAIYAVYSLIRGPIVQWYPYPFLNPTHTSYVAVLLTVIAMIVVGIGGIWLVTRVKRS